MVPIWQFIVANPDGSALGELTAATSKKVTWLLDGAAYAAFTIDGLHPQAALITELETDLIVYDDNGTKRFRGRFGTSQDTIDPTGHSVQFTAVDYRGALGRRIIWDAGANMFTATDQAAIAWALIATSESYAAGAWGITRGTGQSTGVPRERTYTEGSIIGDMLTELGDVLNGFDWEIDANLALNIFYPQRGLDRSVKLDYGGSVAALTRNIDTSKFANAVRYSGATGTTAATALASSIGVTGRFDIQIGQVSITDPDGLTLQGHADQELANDETINPSYVATLTSGWWTPDAFWIGDTGHISVKSGRLNVSDSAQRCSQIDLSIGDDGGETVQLTLGPLSPSNVRDMNNALQRLSALEIR